MGAQLVFVVAVGVAVVHDIQPMPRPTLAIMWRCEQRLDQILIRIWIRITDKHLHVLRQWRQPHQVNVEPPNEGAFVSIRRERQSQLALLGHDEMVDDRLGPVGIRAFNPRDLRPHEWLERPPISTGPLVCVSRDPKDPHKNWA